MNILFLAAIGINVLYAVLRWPLNIMLIIFKQQKPKYQILNLKNP